MANAGARRHDAEIVKGALAPFQELVAFHVAFIFAVHVHLKGARIAEFVDHHRVVDHQIDRVQRVDLFGVAAQRHDPVAHRGQVDHSRNTGEILHQHAGRAIGDFARVLAALGAPFGKRLDVVDADGLAIFKAQHVFQHHLQRGGQAREIAQAGRLGRRNGIITTDCLPDGQRLAGLAGVLSDDNGHGTVLPARNLRYRSHNSALSAAQVVCMQLCTVKAHPQSNSPASQRHREMSQPTLTGSPEHRNAPLKHR